MSPLFYLWIAFALNYIDRQMVYSMFPALRQELGFNALDLAWVGTLFLWSYTLILPLAGALADRWRRDRLILASLLLWSLATAGCGFAQSVSQFLFWRAAMGVTEALYYPTALALLASHYSEAHRSRALGVHQAAQLIGVALGGWYGGWAADHTGWRSAFWIAGAAGLAYSVILARGLAPAPPPASISKTPAKASALAASPAFLALAFAFSAFCSIQWIFFAWFPTFLQQRFSLSMTDSGWNATVFVQGATIAGILLGGALADHWRRKAAPARLYVAAGGVFCSAPFAWLAFSASDVNTCRAASAAFGLFAGGLAANAFSGAYDLLDPRLRGLAAGVLNMCGGLASGAMVLLAGALQQSIGFAGMLIYAIPLAMAGALLLALLARRATLVGCSPDALHSPA
jgi:MFS family permease